MEGACRDAFLQSMKTLATVRYTTIDSIPHTYYCDICRIMYSCGGSHCHKCILSIPKLEEQDDCMRLVKTPFSAVVET